MSKYASKITIIFLLSIALLIFFPHKTTLSQSSTTGSSVNVIDYMFPPEYDQTNSMSNGENFTPTQVDDDEYVYYKQAGRSDLYEKFSECDGYLCHEEDTTWATENGDITTPNGDKVILYFVDGTHGTAGNAASSLNADTIQPMKWVPETMNVGDVFSTQGTIIGINAKTGELVDNQFTGPTNFSMELAYQGPIVLPNGYYSENAIILEIKEGPGAGERFYYDIEKGWIGFDRGQPGTGAYITGTSKAIPVDGKFLDLRNLKYLIASPTPTPPPLICRASDQTPGFFRPSPCKNCGGLTEWPVNSCAESFYARQDTYFHLDPDNEDDDEVKMCEEKDAYAYIERTWKGKVTIDTAKTAVPFAGYHDKVDNQELNYLAQYFAGSLALRGPKNAQGTQEYVEEIQNESGVLAKVLPNDELDKLRCKRIRAAVSDANENYKVPFKKNPNLPEAKKLSEFNGRANSTPCYRPNVPVEQNPTAWKQWDNDMVTWLTTDWAKLWPYIPLTTLKDAPGTMDITVQHNPGTLSLPQAKLTFPHLASLYKSTKTLWEWLTPERIKDINNEDWRVEAETEDPIVASARAIDTQEIEAELDKSDSYCGVSQVYAAEVAKESPILLAQAETEQTEEIAPSTWWNLNVDPGAKYIGDKTYQFDWGILLGRNDDFKTPDGQSIDAFDASHVQLVITAQSSIDSDTIDTGDLIGGNSFANGGSFAYNYDTMRSLTVRAEPGTEITLSVYIKEAAGANMAEKPEYQAKGNTVSMTCKINADGTINLTTCKPSQIPPKDNKKCNNPDGYTPGNCIKDGLADTKKNDFICSSPYPIETDLSVSGYRITLSESQYNAAIDQVRDCFDKCEGHPEGSDERHECQAQCVWVKLSSIKGDLMNRKIGMEVIKIPYLEKVGLYTTRGEEDRQGGIFDIFRPAGFEQFEYKEAKSPINYRYKGLESNSPAPGSKEEKAIANSKADSGSGFLYYPWLGGVEMAKQCVSTVMLQPDISVNEIVASEYCPKLTGTN